MAYILITNSDLKLLKNALAIVKSDFEEENKRNKRKDKDPILREVYNERLKQINYLADNLTVVKPGIDLKIVRS